MARYLLLSLIMLCSTAYGASDVIKSAPIEKEAFNFSPAVQAIFDRLSAAFAETKDNPTARIEMCKNAAAELKSLIGEENIAILDVAREYEIFAGVLEWLEEFEAKKAARAAMRAKVFGFIWDMFNPIAYFDAAQNVWKAGWGNITHVLWNDHRPVVVGSILMASSAGIFVAYKKGLFKGLFTQEEESRIEHNNIEEVTQ